jgi:large subunit ribosomal protein L29
MAKKKEDLKSLSKAELLKKSKEINEQLFKLKLQKETGQLLNTSLLKARRKDLARINTYLSMSK